MCAGAPCATNAVPLRGRGPGLVWLVFGKASLPPRTCSRCPQAAGRGVEGIWVVVRRSALCALVHPWQATKAALYDPDPYWGEGETRTLRSYPEADNRLQRLQKAKASQPRHHLALRHARASTSTPGEGPRIPPA